MKLALVGKGGSGKSALSAMIIRVLSERGDRVLAVDYDRNPGLGVSLGLDAAETPFPEEAVTERPDLPYGWGLADGLSSAEAVRRFSTPAGAGISFLGYGNIDRVDHPLAKYLNAVQQVVMGFDEPGWHVVADIEGGPTMAYEGYSHFADAVLVVVEATPASMLAARRLGTIFGHDGRRAIVVVNKSQGPGDVETVRKGVAAPSYEIPLDPLVRAMERAGSLSALESNAPAYVATVRLVTRIEEWLGRVGSPAEAAAAGAGR